MISFLSESYLEVMAKGNSAPAGPLSVMMIHRTGTDKGYTSQSTYLIFHPQERHPAAVGKVGFDLRSAQYLSREHQALQSVSTRAHDLPRASVPRSLLYREMPDQQILLQSAVRGQSITPRIRPGVSVDGFFSRLLDWAADWSADLGRVTRGDAGALVPVWTEEFSTRLDPTGHSRVLLETAAREVWDAFGQSFPSVMAHGDFCGDNILENQGRFGVIDWELYDELSVPGYDLLDLSLWCSFRSEGNGEVEPFNALERLLNGLDPLARKLRRTLGRYAQRMGYPHEVLPSLFTLAWAGYCLKKLRYLKQDQTGHFARARAGVMKIAATPAEVLAGWRDPR